MLTKFIGYIIVMAAVVMLSWNAHDWLSPHDAAPAATTKVVYVQSAPASDPFVGFAPTSGHLIQDQQQGCYDVRDTCAGH